MDWVLGVYKQHVTMKDGIVERRAHSTGGLAFETCLGGGEAGGGGNGEEDGRPHDVLNWLGCWDYTVRMAGFVQVKSVLSPATRRKARVAPDEEQSWGPAYAFIALPPPQRAQPIDGNRLQSQNPQD